MYLQTTLKIREKANSMLETRAGAGALKMQEKDIVDKNEPAASSTLSEEERTVMRKLFKEMTLVCYMFDVDIRSMVEWHDFDVRNI